MKILYLPLLTLALVGCAVSNPLKGGKATTIKKPVGALGHTDQQNNSLAQVSRQEQMTVKTLSYTLPKGLHIEKAKEVKIDSPKLVKTVSSSVPITNVQTAAVCQAMPVVEHKEARANIELGPQNDMMRKIDMEYSNPKWIVGVMLGVVLAISGWFFTQRYRRLRVSKDANKDDELAEKAWRNL